MGYPQGKGTIGPRSGGGTLPNLRTRIHSMDERMVLQQGRIFRPIKKWSIASWAADLVEEKTTKQIILVQAVTRGFLVRKCTGPYLTFHFLLFVFFMTFCAVRRRMLVANEILLTEKNYVQTLRLVADVRPFLFFPFQQLANSLSPSISFFFKKRSSCGRCNLEMRPNRYWNLRWWTRYFRSSRSS